MARQVLPIVGAVIGAYFGNPQLGYMIGSIVGNAVDPLVVKAPSIGDSRVQTSAEVIRPVYFGTACGAGNIIMAGPDIKRTIENDPGKGGGPVTEEERIYKTFAIGIGDGWTGSIVGISRIWENEKLVFDSRPESQMVAESAKFRQQFTLYTGTESQMPDPDLEGLPAAYGGGMGNVPAFRGLAYIVFKNKDITPWMSIPQYRFEIVTEGTARPPVAMIALAGGGWLPSPDGKDWSASPIPSSNLPSNQCYMLATDETAVAYAQTGNHPSYIEPGDTDWTVATGDSVASVGGPKWGAVNPDGSVMLIPDGLNGNCIRSLDKGRSWTRLAGSLNPGIWAIAAYNFKWYALRGSDIYESTDDGVSWHIDQAGAIGDSGSGVCRASGYGMCAFGGRHVGIPAVQINLTGLDWEGKFLYGMTGSSRVAVMCIGRTSDGLDTLVMVGDGGKIAVYKSGGGVTYSDQEFPSTPNDIAWNGEYFELIGGNLGDTGYIWRSTDGLIWTEAKSGAIASALDSWSSVAAFALSGGQTFSGPVKLNDVVNRIHQLAGQDLAKVDSAALATKSLGGFIIAIDCTAAMAIQTLSSLYQFCSPEYDKQIHHRFHGAAVVRTISDDDLVDEPDEGLREDQIEFPKKLHLEAQNTATGYAPAKETSERESSDVRVVGEMSMSVPVVFAGTAEEQAQEHARYANIMHKVAWENARGEREIVVSDQYLTDVPGDCYLVNIRGRSDRMMITKQNYVDGVIRLTLRYDRASAYTSNRAGNTPSEQNPPPSSIPGDTSLMVLDIPALVDAEDTNTALRHIAMGPNTESWYGAETQESLNLGSTFARIARTSRGAVMGTLQADVTEASEHYTDTTNRVRIQLDLAAYSERVQSLSYAEFLSEGGGFALRNADGDVEILQYMDVDDLGDGLLELTTLLRGRLNTGTFAFPTGSRFVLLSSVTVATTPSSHIGQTVLHRAISYGETAETATTDSVEMVGNSAKEWPVANVLLERTGDTIDVSIVPRHRFGTELNPIRSVNWTNYLIEFRDALDQVETVSSIAAELNFDASAMTFPIEVTVWQVNRFPWGTSDPVTEEIE